MLNSLQHEFDERVDGVLVVWVGLAGEAVGDDHAAGSGFMSEQEGKACERAAFHLEVSDAVTTVFEVHNLLVRLRVGKRQANDAYFI